MTRVNKRVKSPHLLSVHYLSDFTIPITRVINTYGSPELSIDNLFGIALRIRWLWLRRAGSARALESLLSAEEKAIGAVFSVATESILGDGRSTLFCTDRRIQGESIKSIATDGYETCWER
jgi:hypothetical protein